MYSLSPQDLPSSIQTEDQLDELLTRPSPTLIEFIKSVSSPPVILGAGGKMGPTMAQLARPAAHAASHHLEIIAASRFSDPKDRSWLEKRGIKTVRADLLCRGDVAALPDPG